MKSPDVVSIVTAPAVLAVLSLMPVIAGGQATANVTAQAKGGSFPWQLTVYDHQGKFVRTVGEFANDSYPAAFSPDGTRLAVVEAIPGGPGADISVFDLSTGASTRVVSGPAPRGLVWSPDGSQVAYYSYRQGYGGLYRKASNGTGREQLLYRFTLGVDEVNLIDWSRDGRFLALPADWRAASPWSGFHPKAGSGRCPTRAALRSGGIRTVANCTIKPRMEE